jgi:hypothetical protein
LMRLSHGHGRWEGLGGLNEGDAEDRFERLVLDAE